MIDIKIHKNENNQLFSIKGIEYDYSSKMYVLRLLAKLVQSTSSVFIYARRNNYKDSSIEKLKIQQKELGIRNLRIDKKLFDVSFDFNASEASEELLSILVDLWYSFQQPGYCFFLEEEEFTSNYKGLLTGNWSWKQIVDSSNSYVMFRGAEDDVVWLGKSIDLELHL